MINGNTPMHAETFSSIGSTRAGMAIGLSNVSAAEGAKPGLRPQVPAAESQPVKELRQFPENNPFPGETCGCLGRGWFWQEGARPKTAKQVLALMTTVNSRNSNFLLHVGPNKQGRFEEASVNVSAEVGDLRKAKAGENHAK